MADSNAQVKKPGGSHDRVKPTWIVRRLILGALFFAETLAWGTPPVRVTNDVSLSPAYSSRGVETDFDGRPFPDGCLVRRGLPRLRGFDSEGRVVLAYGSEHVVVAANGRTTLPAAPSAVASPLVPFTIKPAPHRSTVNCNSGGWGGPYDKGSGQKWAAPAACEIPVRFGQLPGVRPTLIHGPSVTFCENKSCAPVLYGKTFFSFKPIEAGWSADGRRWAILWRGMVAHVVQKYHRQIGAPSPDPHFATCIVSFARGGAEALVAQSDGLRRLKHRDLRGALASFIKTVQLAPYATGAAVHLGRALAVAGRRDEVLALVNKRGPDRVQVAAALMFEAETSRMRDELQQFLPRVPTQRPARWRREALLGASTDGRFFALRREARSWGGPGEVYLELIENRAPYFSYLRVKVESYQEAGRLDYSHKAAANILLAAFGIETLATVKGHQVGGSKGQDRSGLMKRRSYQISGQAWRAVELEQQEGHGRTLRLTLGQQVLAEVQPWELATRDQLLGVSELLYDTSAQRLYLFWSGASCEVGFCPDASRDVLSIVDSIHFPIVAPAPPQRHIKHQ